MSDAKTLELLIMGNSNANHSRSERFMGNDRATRDNQALPKEQLLQNTKHKTAKAIWDALKTRHIDETIDTFTGKLTTLVNKAASLGHTIEDSIVIRKLLNVVPDKYLQIVASIEQYSDLDEMSVDEAIGRLKTFEERLKSKKEIPVDSQESLMFTRHEGAEIAESAEITESAEIAESTETTGSVENSKIRSILQ
ncbi:hypothetical protein Tco_1529656 [Tanacetum coccineum]